MRENFYRNEKVFFHLLLISLVIFLVFFKSLSFDFLWMDHFQIQEEGCILKSWQELKQAFFTPILDWQSSGNYYRPLFKIFYTLNYLIYGKERVGFRATALGLHILNLWLFYFILLRMGFSLGLSLLLSTFYGGLPLVASNLVLLGAAGDLLAGFFILSAFLFYLEFRRRESASFFVGSLLCYWLALLSKEIAFPFFLLIGICQILERERLQGKKGRRFLKAGRFFPYLGIALLYLLLRFKAVGHWGTRVKMLRGEPYTTVLSSLVGFLRYLEKFFYPVNLAPADAFPKYRSLFQPEVLVAMLALILLTLTFLSALCKKNFPAAFSLGWIFSFYLPISNLIPALHFWAERFFYLAGFGVIFLLGFLLSERKILKRFLLLLLPLYFALTIRYEGYFKNDLLLFSRALKVSPFSKEPHAMLGFFYLSNNQNQKAIYHYYLSLQPEENYYTYVPSWQAYNNLAVALLRLNQYQQAERWLEAGLRLSPGNKIILANMHILDKKLGK